MSSGPTDKFVSVVMPVRNAMPHLDDAIASIIGQSHSNFEFVILDDSSTDGSREQLREWAQRDERIRLFEGTENLGPVGSSAFVVRQSTASFVARMDADDICSPVRLERQIQVLLEHPDAGLVGTLFEVIDAAGNRLRGPEVWRLARKSPLVPFAAHGSIMFRRKVFDQVGGYRRACEYWEDQDLVVRIAEAADVLVIPEALYKVRQWTKTGRIAADTDRVEHAIDLMYRSVERLERGQSYDDLLTGALNTGSRVNPRVFISTGSMLLWAGDRPRLFRRLLSRGRLGPNLGSVAALVWTAWASLNPASLRAFLRVLLKARNLGATPVVSKPKILRWSPNRAATAACGKVPEARE